MSFTNSLLILFAFGSIQTNHAMERVEETQKSSAANIHTAFPADILKTIIFHPNLGDSLEEVAYSIRSLAHTHPRFYAIINSPETTQALIANLSQRFDYKYLVGVASALRTSGAGKWMSAAVDPKTIHAAFINSARVNNSRRFNFFIAHINPKMIDAPEKYFEKEDSTTALGYAAEAGNLTKVNALLAAGANVNHQSFFQITPLMEATREGHYEVVKRLLDAGADLSLRSHFGNSIFWYASFKPNKKIKRLLRSRLTWKQWLWHWVTGK